MTALRRVLLLNAYSANHAERLRGLLTTEWEVATALETEPTSRRDEELARADALVHSRFSDAMPQGLKLALIQTPTAGFDRIDPAALPKGCLVCNVHEHEVAIAEYVLAAMLQWVIGIADLDRRFRGGDWRGGVARLGHMHGELGGRTLGIIGHGRIGSEVARRAQAFGMRGLGVTRRPRAAPENVDRLANLDGLDALLPQCDVVLVACPLTPATRGMVDARRLALMKRGAFLINVARAAIIDEEALFVALKDGVIAGAALDVWYAYPSPEEPEVRPSRFPFHTLDTVIMTPHASAWTHELIERRWRFIAANLDRFARGEALLNVVIRDGRIVEGESAEG